MRLDRARRLLKEGRASTVTEVALAVGIPHFGRFANEYRKMFGEVPSQTRLD